MAESSSFLPECWRDDERMSSLMSMFKNRMINQVEFDSKLKFWSNLITSSSLHLKKPTFLYADLIARFKRNDRIPAGLNVVLKDMLEKGEITTVDNFMASTSAGWVSWGIDLALKRPLIWLLGFNREPDVTKSEFVLPKVLEELCHNVMEIRREENEKWSPSEARNKNIIEYKQFLKQMRPHGFDEKSLALIVEQLRRLKIVSVAIGDDQEKLLKFEEQSANDTINEITESDRNFYKLQKTVETLENELQHLEEAVAKLDEEARVQIRAGNRAKAKQILRQKLNYLKRIRSKEAAFNNCFALMNQLAQTKEQKQVLDAFKAGVSAFKADLAKHGLSVDKVDETMDEIQEALADHRDISEALAGSPAICAVSSDAELEDELAELLKEPEADESVFKLPDAPQISTSTPVSKKPDDNLARLRRALEKA